MVRKPASGEGRVSLVATFRYPYTIPIMPPPCSPTFSIAGLLSLQELGELIDNGMKRASD